ncbi:RHS repeat-associated core domain-containing protein [Phytohabitans aurantiacus]|uniref:Teneurin-like YD-shell domain-containing protein n=1 Tax=Phytohabitans aurantiacus TaxID=3016789 RepID=A0ABQ5R998_9ACTN|nr:RHS repeat-associated core domain-containing protein [Phytohabitans aurantiacus]GLI03334.1 hypothetical protein Pa4123_86120 [Phytohabitans aurantiacus]
MRKHPTRWLAAGLAAILMVTLADPAAAHAVPSNAAPAVVPNARQKEPVVPVTPVPVRGKPAAAAPAKTTALPATAWPTAGSAEVRLPAFGAKAAAAGKLPVRVASAQRGTPPTVRVDVRDQNATRKAGVAGLLFDVRRTDRVATKARVSLSVDYGRFRYAYGGDWASRLRLVRLSDRAVIPSRNDQRAGTLSAQVDVGADPAAFAVTAAASGPAGNYGATPLALSSSWQVSTHTGDFSWSYPLRVPPVPGELVPQLSLGYSSGALDGRTSVTNNQPSWAGDGFDLTTGYIERSYKGCADDLGGNNGQRKTYDQCWFNENATLSLAGHSGPLLRISDTEWKLKNDDGSRIQRLTRAANGDNDGEYWKVTTREGIQYFFGVNQLPNWAAGKAETNSVQTVPVFGNNTNEPCNTGTYAGSVCTQAYRWNLDHVVDPRGNTMSYWYEKEYNWYGLDLGRQTVRYDRTSVLKRIDYGTRHGEELAGTAPARIVFGSAPRCAPDKNCTLENPDSYPDVPFDQKCAANCTDKVSPTFWATQRLASVTTYVGAEDVDQWTLTHSFPPPGDHEAPGLSLDRIVHTGLYGGEAAMPPVTFRKEAFANRVNNDSDGIAPLAKFRVTAVDNEYGGVVSVNYAPTNCTANALPRPESNPLRCFPVYWQPEGGQARTDWMHKYVVASVTQYDGVGDAPTEVMSYEYRDGGAWRYTDSDLISPDRRTWSEWRGYANVVVRHGDDRGVRSVSEYQYFRGMNGDHQPSGTRTASVPDSQGGSVPDDDQFAGQMRERRIRDDEGGPVASITINDMWSRHTATHGKLRAYQVDTAAVREYGALSSGGWRRSQVNRVYNDDGLVEKVDEQGDLAVTGDEECTRTWYTGSRPTRTETVAVSCATPPVYPRDAISDLRTTYDDAGNAIKAEQVVEYAGGEPVLATTNRATYDRYGRPLETFDALDRKTTTGYTETGGLNTEMTVTNGLNHTTTTEVSPAWGEPVATVDPNGRRTDVEHDALGRVTGVWLPGRRKDVGEGPNLAYHYQLRNDRPSAVSTETLRANGNYVTSYVLYDGFLRPRQTQGPGWGDGGVVDGRVITDTIYDSRGLVSQTNASYYAEGAPGTTLVAAGDNTIPSQTITVHDGLGRPTHSILQSFGVEKWRSSVTYHGDRTDQTPPAGGTATTMYTDAEGKTTELHQYRGPAPTGPAQITRYTYTNAGQLATVTDQDGRQWRYEYDLRGRRLKTHDPDTGTSSSTYDAAGQVLTTTDARGQSLKFVYDTLGRKTEERAVTADAEPLRAKWTYDVPLKGLPTSSSRFEGANEYKTTVTGYDAASRPTGSRLTIPSVEQGLAGNYDSSVTYRVDGSVASTTLPAAGDLAKETLTFEYDDLGLLKTTSGADSYVDDTFYSRFGELSQLSIGDAGAHVWNTLYYDYATRRPARSLVEREKATGVQVNDLRYHYDPAGNLHKIEDVPAGGTADRQCFTYDHLRRLTEAWTTAGDCTLGTVAGNSPYWTSYRYDTDDDTSGNRTSETRHGLGGVADTTRTYRYEQASHALESVITSGPNGSMEDRFGYDESGNTTTRNLNGSTQTLTWDTSGRLARARSADGKDTSFVYDANGSRLLRRDPTSVTLYLGGQEIKLDKTSGVETGTRFYSHGGLSVGVRTAAGLHWRVSDHHGTAISTLKSDTLAVTRRQSMPFGETRGTAPNSWPDDKDFVGGTRDDSVGLVQLGARSYDPALGRFISVDPIIDPSDPQQLNGYAYANNNPISMSDPDGLKVFVDVDGQVSIPSLKYATKAQINKAAAKAKKIQQANKKIKQKRAAAIKATGHTQEEYEKAKLIQQKSVLDVVIEAGGIILQEFLGINDIKDCFGGGSIGACISMVIGVIPWTKLHRIGDLIGAVKKAWNAVMNFDKMKDWAKGVTSAVEKGMKDFNDWLKKSGSPSAPACTTAGAAHSFRADTKVRMADGSRRPIAQVKLGDKVLATDPETGRTTAQRVTALHVNRDTDLTDVTVTVTDKRTPARRAAGPQLALAGLAAVGALAAGTTTVLHTTDHHPFWDETAKVWVGAGDLAVGHELRTADGRVATVTGVRSFPGPQTMHDLTVDAIHTYYVQAANTPVLVHNCGSAVEAASIDDLTDLAKGNPGDALSPAGRAYQKHTNPATRTPAHIEKYDVGPVTTNADRTLIGNYHVEDIMTNPSVVETVNHSASAHYGGITRDFKLPGDGRGVRWSMRGGVATFEGFL